MKQSSLSFTNQIALANKGKLFFPELQVVNIEDKTGFKNRLHPLMIKAMISNGIQSTGERLIGS